MSDDVKPALSPEAWEQQIEGTAYIKRGGWTEIGLGVYATISSDPSIPEQNDTLNPEYGCRPPYLILHWHTVEEAMAIHQPHRLAALCLYQQPFGFTSDDVGLCESVARDIVLGLKDLQVRQGDPARDEEQDWACDTLNRRLRSLASRIQALLPPSEESQPDTNEP